MDRRRFLSLMGTGTAITTAGCSSETDDSESNPDSTTTNETDTPTVSTESDQSDNGLLFESGESHEFEGTETDETSTFELSRGAMRYEYDVSPSGGTFQSDLVYMSDERGDLLDDINLTNIGTPIQGEFFNLVSGGEYRISVATPGDWLITINQPAVSEEDSLNVPIDEDGEQPTYIGLVDLPADAEVTATKSSGDLFQLHTITPSGGWNLPINDSTQPEVTRSMEHNGLVFVNVVGEGQWSLTIE